MSKKILAVTVMVTIPEEASDVDIARLHEVLNTRAARWVKSVMKAKGAKE